MSHWLQPVPTGRFFARSGRVLLPREVWLDEDGSLPAYAVGYYIVPEVEGQEYLPEREVCTTITSCVPAPDPPGGPPICEDITTCEILPEQPYIEAVPGYAVLNHFPYSREFPANAMNIDSSLAHRLNAAICPGTSIQTEAYGPLQPEPSQDPKLEIASCVLYNVKTWRISGHIRSYSFDQVIHAGTFARYVDGALVEDTLEPSARSYLSTGLVVEFYPEDYGGDSASLSVAIGRPFPAILETGANGFGYEVMHFSPTTLVYQPKLNIQIRDRVGSRLDSASSEAGHGPGFPDGNVTFCGRSLMMTTVYGDPPPEDYSLEISPHTFWTSGQWHA